MFRPEAGAGGVQAPATLSLGRLHTDEKKVKICLI
jgi:hypothetical protein